MAGRKPRMSSTSNGHAVLEALSLEGVALWISDGEPIDGTLLSQVMTGLFALKQSIDIHPRFSGELYLEVFLDVSVVCPATVRESLASRGKGSGHSNVSLVVRVLHEWAAYLDNVAARFSELSKGLLLASTRVENLGARQKLATYKSLKLASVMQTAVEANNHQRCLSVAREWAGLFLVRRNGKLYYRYERELFQLRTHHTVEILGVEFELADIAAWVSVG